MKERKLGIYITIPAVAFTTQMLGGVIRPYEIAILIAMLLAVFTKNSGFRRITPLDLLVIAFAAYQLIGVLVSSELFHESARSYRYIVLGPVLIYFVIRTLPFSIKTFTKAHFLLSAVLLIQTGIVISLYLQTGDRPAGLTHVYVGYVVPYSLLASYISMFLIFSWKNYKSVMAKLLAATAITIMLFGLLVSASRGVALPTLLMLFLSSRVWRSVRLRRVITLSAKSLLVVTIFLVAFTPPKLGYDPSQLLESKRSIERIISIDDYLFDITQRLQFWSGLFEIAMKKPILGHGAAAYALGPVVKSSGIGHNPHHAHNILISTVLASGLIGLLIVLALLFLMYTMVGKFRSRDGPEKAIEKTLLMWSMVYLVVSLTNGVMGVLFFFILALIQQLALHSGRNIQKNDSPNDRSINTISHSLNSNNLHRPHENINEANEASTETKKGNRL